MGAASSRTASEYVETLSHEAVLSSGVPVAVAAYAAAATLRALGRRPIDSTRLSRRYSAYFWAVARRKLVRAGGSSGASARMVLESVVSDLVQAGRDSTAVWSEIERGWADRVPPEILEEYRMRVCA